MALTSAAYFPHPSYLVHLWLRQQLLQTTDVVNSMETMENSTGFVNNDEMVLSFPINVRVVAMVLEYFLRNYELGLDLEHPVLKIIFIDNFIIKMWCHCETASEKLHLMWWWQACWRQFHIYHISIGYWLWNITFILWYIHSEMWWWCLWS